MIYTKSLTSNNLEELYGFNVNCECEMRIRLLIDFGVYAIEHPDDYKQCIFDCRLCQHDRMIKGRGNTFRIL